MTIGAGAAGPPAARTGYVLAACGLATLLVGYGGSILFIALPAIARENRAGVGQLAALGATLAVGSVIAIPLASLADRRGRGLAAAIGIAGFSLAALATALSRGIEGLAIARVAAVCFETLVVAIATAAALEAVGNTRRGVTASFLALSAGAGAALTVVAYPLVAPHWRLLYFAAALGLPLAPLGLRIPGRRAAASPDSRLGVLMGSPWRTRVGVLVSASAMGGLLYEPANFFGVLFGSQQLHLDATTLSIVVAASGVAAGLGYVAGGLLTDRAGRRRPAVLLGVVSAIVAAASFVPNVAVYVAAGVVASATASAAAPVLGAWIAELVPSRARVTAFTVIGVGGSLGGVAGLGLSALLAPRIGLGGSLGVAAVVAAAGALALLALPETRGTPLPE